MLSTTLQVALGGAIGAALRFALASNLVRLSPAGFPIGIMTVNILGSFIMGLAVVWLGRTGQNHLQPFLMGGILGGFTTFSAFSLEAITLIERGQIMQATGYIAGSVALSLAGLALGVWIARAVFA